MKFKKHCAKKIIHFYLNYTFSSNLFCRNFSENNFLNISSNFNSNFLILKVLTGDFDLKTHYEWLVIFIKRSLFFFLPKYQKSNSIKLFETIIEISSCSNKKIFQLFEENLKILFIQKNKNKNFEKFIFSKIFKTIEEKLTRKKTSNFSISILSILLLFVSNSSEEFRVEFFNYFCWILSEFLLKIADLQLIYLGEHQIKCILLVENIFDQFKNEFSNRNISYSIILDILIMFSNFYFSTVYPNLYKKLFWKTIGKVENNFFISIQNFEREKVTFFPIFFGFFFLDSGSDYFYFNCSKILLLTFIFISNNFKRILDCKESLKQLSLIFKNLLLIKNQHRETVVPNFKFFSIDEKFNHDSKKFYINQILNSIKLKKKTILLYPKFIDFIQHLFISNCDLFSKISILFLITVKHGTPLKGIMVNKYNKKIKKEVFKITESKLNQNCEKGICHIIDFFSGYRYQIPIKKLFDIVKTILQKKIEDFKIKAHVFNFFERILSIRGNDGNGRQLLDFNFDGLKRKINIDYLSLINLNHLNNSRGLFSKFFMRIIGQLDIICNLENTLSIKFMGKILRKLGHQVKQVL